MASIVHLNQRLAASEQPAAGSWLAALEGDDAPGRDRSAARGLVQRLAGELAGHGTTIASAVARRMLAAEERLSDPDDPSVEDLATRFAHANVGAILAGLAHGVPLETAPPPHASTALLDRMAERDDGLDVVLRGHRLVMADVWRVWAAFTAERVLDAGLLHAALALSTGQVMGYTDSVSEHLAPVWSELRRNRRRGVDVPVGELVRRALFAPPPVAEAALARLGLPVDAVHLAVAVPAELPAGEADRIARRLRLATHAEALAAPGPEQTTIWLAFTRAPTATETETVRSALDAAAPAGLGELGQGQDGFRETCRQATDALRIATLRGATGVTDFRDVALLAVLCADETRARELARDELGPLAADDEVAARLRETLRVYLACGASQVAAAQRLFVHEKTVKYRLRQAERLLARDINERRSELEAALMVHHIFAAAPPTA